MCDERGIPNKSMIIKWNQCRSKIFEEVALNRQKRNEGNIKEMRQRRKLRSKRVGRNEYFQDAARLVVADFKLRRARGAKVSKLWFCKKMKAKIEQVYGKEQAETFKASSNWFQRFKKRHNISLRRRTNKKKDSADFGRAKIQEFHQNLRKAVQSKRRRALSLDPVAKYGRWPPKNRYNVDQVLLPFVCGQDSTYETKGTDQVWISQPASGLEKRQATLQLCIRAESEQTIKPSIIFRGQGKVQLLEKSMYDERVDVYFQKAGWIDEEVNIKWVSNTSVPGMEKSEEEKIMFADNASFQCAQTFHEKCRGELNTVVYLLPSNHTDKVQPIDAGFGNEIKKKIGENLERWLEKDDNVDKWHDKLSARERRILMTQWLGDAWDVLKSKSDYIWRLFQKLDV